MADTRSRRPSGLTSALETLGRRSLRDLSMDELLKTVADLAGSVMPGRPESSVTILAKDHPSTIASSGQLATQLDENQYAEGQGPCLHAARSGEVTEITDTRTEVRWGDYASRAAEHGCLSSLSIPLLIDEEAQVCGALNVYARQADAFDDAGRSAAADFASYAAVAAGNLYAFRNAQDTADNLRVALQSRAVIDQAKGILMERHKLTADRAFQMLAQASMSSNVKVRDVAEHLTRTGELPRARPPRS